MPENILALIYILALSIPILIIGRRPTTVLGMEHAAFNRRRNLWIAITILAFLSYNFWVFIIFSMIIILFHGRHEDNKMAMFLFILFAVPMLEERIPSPAIIDYFFDIHYGRLLCMAILFPVWIHAKKDLTDSIKFGKLIPDKILIAYLVLKLILSLRSDTYTATHLLREHVFYAFTDIFLPYYVASRTLTSRNRLQDALLSYIVAMVIMGSICFFEFVRHYLLYSSLNSVWNKIGRAHV